MVLLGMVHDEVVDAVDSQPDEIGDKVVLLGGIDRVNKCGLFAAPDKVGIVTGA